MARKFSREDTDMHVGENIRYYRKLRNMSQRDIAKQLEINKGIIGHFETGLKVPSLMRAREIASILNVSLDTLVNEKRENLS